MAKKKSKTQKNKQNQKKKIKNTQKKKNVIKKVTKKTTPIEQKTKTKEQNILKKDIKKTNSGEQVLETKKVVDKSKVTYNVALELMNKENVPQKEKQLVSKDKVKYNVLLTNSKKNPEKKVEKNIKQQTQNNKHPKSQNIIFKAFHTIKNNLHILFNAALIVTYIILLIGLIRSNAFTKGTIIYISCITIFLILVATAYTKYLSGKIFSILIIIGMSLGIYKIQYTYDFINNLNSNEYEYKTYYVVTFKNGQNKSIYNINNKKICLLKDNSKNIERKLNTKLDSAIYIEYKDQNDLYSDFYDTNCRAIIVNENQYKYLNNNIESNSRDVKILYEFKANGKK